jgi:hypothetical protein
VFFLILVITLPTLTTVSPAARRALTPKPHAALIELYKQTKQPPTSNHIKKGVKHATSDGLLITHQSYHNNAKQIKINNQQTIKSINQPTKSNHSIIQSTTK